MILYGDSCEGPLRIEATQTTFSSLLLNWRYEQLRQSFLFVAHSRRRYSKPYFDIEVWRFLISRYLIGPLLLLAKTSNRRPHFVGQQVVIHKVPSIFLKDIGMEEEIEGDPLFRPDLG